MVSMAGLAGKPKRRQSGNGLSALFVVLMLGGFLSGCGARTLSGAVPTPGAVTPVSETDVALSGGTTCVEYDSRIWAQTIYDADPSGSAGLDPDGDGLACEELPLGAAPALWANTVPESAIPVALVSVTDGDTIRVDVNGAIEPVRLVGIDTHETGGPYVDLECYGPEATNYLTWLLGQGGQIFLEKDQEERDRYGRLLRWVWLEADDGEVYLVNEALARAGFAERYRNTPNRRYVDQIIAAEAFAERHGIGLWGACNGAG
jgi:micrococcal nuclease